MLASTYMDHVKFLKNGSFPTNFPSNKSNFKRASGSMSVNKKGTLLRDGKFVVKRSERKAIFQGNSLLELHQQNLSLSQGTFWARCDLEQDQGYISLAWWEELCIPSSFYLCGMCPQKLQHLASFNAPTQANSRAS